MVPAATFGHGVMQARQLNGIKRRAERGFSMERGRMGGAHGKPALFLRPKDFNGALIELEQV